MCTTTGSSIVGLEAGCGLISMVVSWRYIGRLNMANERYYLCTLYEYVFLRHVVLLALFFFQEKEMGLDNR